MKHLNIGALPDYISTSTSNMQLSLGQVILLLSQEHDEQTVIKLTRKFCLQTTSNEIRKKGLEFLYINGFYEDLQLLIEKNRSTADPSNRQWAEIYQVILERRLKKYAPQMLINRLSSFVTDEPELKCLIELTKVVLYYDQGDFSKIGNFLNIKQNLFEKIEDNFFLSSLNLRLYQQLFIYYWMRNELIMARKYAFRALNEANNAKTRINLHINLGLSYIYDTYFQGMYHLKEALKLAKQHHLDRYVYAIEQRNIPFISAHFGKVDGLTTEDKSEQAHIEIAKGNNCKAISILENLPLCSPFQLYYMGVAKEDRNILLKSYNHFIEKRSDYFFSRLPLAYLKV